MNRKKHQDTNLPPPTNGGLYAPDREHDACGMGFVADLNGRRSHEMAERGIEVLRNLLHRGATGADADTGDGAGLMIQLPHELLRACGPSALPPPGAYGLAMCFLPPDEDASRTCRVLLEQAAAGSGLQVLGWRAVPTDPDVLGEQARRCCPAVFQAFIDGCGLADDDLERRLYLLRRRAERAIRQRLGPDSGFYVPSCSSRTVVFKGLMLPDQVPGFYADLRDQRLTTALAVIHQRYSTNTFPSWRLAQPLRFLAHNGEINTLRGNINWMRSREKNLACDHFEDIEALLPVIETGGSDSSCLDNVLELLYHAGRPLDHAMLMLIPQAWGDKYPIGPDLRGFFEYHAGLMEPWDGPAAVVFCDGRQVGVQLDRNGLRPARYTLMRDGFMVCASEAGVLDLPASRVRERGSLRPGQMLLADLRQQRLVPDTEIKMRLARRQPYRRWVEENRITVHGFFDAVEPVQPDTSTLLQRQRMFGYTREELEVVLKPMAASGKEPIGSMGADHPPAVLSNHPQLLYDYFRQLFAQVTNPAIDPIREELVMSLMTFMGNPDNILTEKPQHCRLVKLRHPILSNEDLHRLGELHCPDFRAVRLPISMPAGGDGREMADALDRMCRRAAESVADGNRLLILSDRDIDDNRVPLPALLAVSAVNRRLVDCGRRTSVALLVETAEAREVMHMALLLGYGATAVNPYLAFETITQMSMDGLLDTELDISRAVENYVGALCKGLLKIMSRAGLSTLRSYRSAQIFEAVGLHREVIDCFFPGTPSRIGGLRLDDLAAEVYQRCRRAREPDPDAPGLLPPGGLYRYRRGGERHLWTPAAIHDLQQAARGNDRTLYRSYAQRINDQQQRQYTLRGLLRLRPAERSVPLDEVEPAQTIVKRFVTGAMSFGSISREAHETLAIAMNRLGGMSNSGEGGEDPDRYSPLPNGDSRRSSIKQIASGRFGVTAEYLAEARELQIKIAQGAKPGEGGQLPGHKVNREIARVRHSTPGVTLISPPPHHDIYSIEDIAQLIYDLRNANDEARISVKLVSEIGVGTVAAGVAKGRADMILISGGDGGTGASPLSSIRHAGVPWELGLAETQQTLVRNGLRDRVRIQADGQLKTGRDVVVAALLGAEEYGFATAALVVCGCVMMRHCHRNTCPVGIATQDPQLRKRYTGRPEYVINFLNMLAEEVREHLARLGARTLDEVIGRADLLEADPAVEFWKTRGIDLGGILQGTPGGAPRRALRAQDTGLAEALDYTMMEEARPALEEGQPVILERDIRNVHRTVGTLLSSRIVRRHGGAGLPEDTLTLRCRGSAGQSFAAFCCTGMTLELSGEANDYLAKGLSGARVVLRPFADAGYEASDNIIAGNVALYGATSGEVYIHGQAGERFAIRNSGVRAVVEGIGDHGCEYMTGGRVVVLGRTGVNFAAGMSGGIAYVYDREGDFDTRCNLEMVDLELLIEPDDIGEVRELVERHRYYTGSRRAIEILEDWDTARRRFLKVFPMEYRRVLGQMSREDEATKRAEPAPY